MRRFAALVVFGTVSFFWVRQTLALGNVDHLPVAAGASHQLKSSVEGKIGSLFSDNRSRMTTAHRAKRETVSQDGVAFATVRPANVFSGSLK